jgi:hypothetical protein
MEGSTTANGTRASLWVRARKFTPMAGSRMDIGKTEDLSKEVINSRN